MPAGSSDLSNSDLSRTLAKVLGAPELRQYYHFDELPERRPLQVVDRAQAGFPPGPVDGTDIDAVVVAPGAEPSLGRAEFIIEGVSTSEGNVVVEFRFPAEGLSGTATLSRLGGDGWRIEALDIREN